MSDTRAKRADGIRTLDDLLSRCERDDETGCMIINAPKRRGSHYVWLPAMGKPVGLPVALAHLMGQQLERGQRWVPICGETGCCNPEHRFIGTRSDLMMIMRPALDPLHRQRIAAGKRARPGARYSAELRAEIMASEESSVEIARRTGIHWSHICRIRRGEAWREAAPAASVFHLGAGL